MVPIYFYGPLNGTNSLEGCRFFRSSQLHLYMELINYSLSTTKRPLMESHMQRRRLFLICSYIIGANSLANNVYKTQHVFCLQTQSPIRTPAQACSVSGRPGGHILIGFSLLDAPLHVSRTKIRQLGAWRQAATE